MEYLLVLIYGAAFAAILYYMIQLKPLHSANDELEKATTAVEQPKSWPWQITSYSFWPQWMSVRGTKKVQEEGYGYDDHGQVMGHGGGYGYTGREVPIKSCSFEGDGQGYDMNGGSYGGGGGYGYTGREKQEDHCHSHTHAKHIQFS